MPYFLIKRIFYPIKNAYFSTAIFALGTFFYFAFSPFSDVLNSFFHIGFFVCAFLNFALLMTFNRSKTFFESAMVFCSYLLFINIKKIHGLAYWMTPEYCYLSAFIPLNLCYFMFWENNQKLLSKKTIYIFLALLVEYSTFENLSIHNMNLLSFSSFFGLNNFSVGIFALVLIICFFKMNKFGGEAYKAYFFEILSLFFAFLLSFQTSAVCLFFFLTALITFVDSACSIYKEIFYDNITCALNKRSFFVRAKQVFPIRYCVSVTRIDDCDTIIRDYGYKSFYKVLKMSVAQLCEAEGNSGVYRISPNLFLLLFFDKTKNEGFEIMENIRRKIATSEFITYHPKNNIKITITSAVTEGRRSDAANKAAIISRAYDKIKSSLSQNVTLKA